MAKASRRRIEFPELDAYIRQLNAISSNSLTIIEKAIAEGAKPVADAIKASLQAVESVSEEQVYHDRSAKRPTKITHEQKEGLIESFGLAPMRDDRGFINTKAGFDGYNKVQTRYWPNGQPNAMIARTLESGSTYMQKQPFLRKSINSAKDAAVKKMQEYYDKEIEKITKK